MESLERNWTKGQKASSVLKKAKFFVLYILPPHKQRGATRIDFLFVYVDAKQSLSNLEQYYPAYSAQAPLVELSRELKYSQVNIHNNQKGITCIDFGSGLVWAVLQNASS